MITMSLMTSHSQQLREFHETFGHPAPDKPTNIDTGTLHFRWNLFAEEYNEYMTAWVGGDLVEIADALGDMAYILFGTATVHGIDLSPVFDEIHRSNMSKLGEDGKPIYREDGKVLKGPNYFRPNIEGVLFG